MDAVRSKTTFSPLLNVLLPPETAAISSELSTVIVCPTPTEGFTGQREGGYLLTIRRGFQRKQETSKHAIALTGTVGKLTHERRQPREGSFVTLLLSIFASTIRQRLLLVYRAM